MLAVTPNPLKSLGFMNICIKNLQRQLPLSYFFKNHSFPDVLGGIEMEH